MTSFRSSGFYSSTPSSTHIASWPQVADLVPIRQPPLSCGSQDVSDSPESIQSPSNTQTPPSLPAIAQPMDETIQQRLSAMERIPRKASLPTTCSQIRVMLTLLLIMGVWKTRNTWDAWNHKYNCYELNNGINHRHTRKLVCLWINMAALLWN